MLRIRKEKVDDGVSRLLNAPKDLQRWDEGVGDPGTREASDAHRQLFADYRRELRGVVREAIDGWDRGIEECARATGNRKKCLRDQWSMIPAGPAAEPAVVAVVRRYWLACDELNRRTPALARVAPEAFLLGWLRAEGSTDTEVLQVLSLMPYWPIGLDPEGRWI